MENKLSPESFCYWLRGHFEMNPDVTTLSEVQVKMIKDHLSYVFTGKYPPHVITVEPGGVVTIPTSPAASSTGTQQQGISAPPVLDYLKYPDFKMESLIC